MKKTSLELAEFEIAAKGLLQKSSREAPASFGHPPAALRTHGRTSSCTPHGTRTKWVPPAYILILSSKPRPSSVDNERQPFWVKSAPPRAYSSVYCAIAERFNSPNTRTSGGGFAG